MCEDRSCANRSPGNRDAMLREKMRVAVQRPKAGLGTPVGAELARESLRERRQGNNRELFRTRTLWRSRLSPVEAIMVVRARFT